MEMVVEKAYDMFQNNVIDTPDKMLGKMDTLSFAGRMELKNYVLWAKGQFETWMNSTTDTNP